MPSLPPQDNRVLLAFEALQHDILSGNLSSPLPGERALAARLQISRKTLRKAMELLEKEHWVSPAEQGRRRQLLKAPQQSNPTENKPALLGKTVITIAPRPLHLMGGIERLFQNRLTRYCEKYGITLKHRHIDVRHLKDPSHRLSAFILQTPADAYLLQHSTLAIQQWFASQEIPSIILGERWGDLRLPSVAGDHVAMATHTASLLHRYGHKSVALLMPSPSKRGLEIFAEKLKLAAPSVHFVTVKHEETPESTSEAVTTLLTRLTSAPTLAITAHAFATVSLSSAAGQLGRRIPEDLSILCLAHDEALNYLTPPTTAYDIHWENYTKAVLHSLSDLLRHPGSPILDAALIMPEYLKGASLASLK